MKLISHLDFCGNDIYINGAGVESANVLHLPKAGGTIARLEDITAQHAFSFKGNAKEMIKTGTYDGQLMFTDAQKTAAIAAGVPSGDFTIVSEDHNYLAANAGSGELNGFVFQVDDKEYASNGTAWVELGLNIDLSDLVTETELAGALGWDIHAQGATSALAKLEAAIGWDALAQNADSVKNKLDDMQAAIEDNEEVVATALNDHEGRIDTLEDTVAGLGTDAIKEIYLTDSQTPLTVTDNAVTVPAVSQSADGLMSSEDKTKLDTISLSNIAVTFMNDPAIVSGTSVTIGEDIHGCGTFPMVQVYRGYDVVTADVSVAQASNGDITVSWTTGFADAEHPIRIRIVGNMTQN